MATIKIRREGYVPLQFRFRRESGRRFVGANEVVKLPPSLWIGGRWSDEDGQPIAGEGAGRGQFFSGPSLSVSWILKSGCQQAVPVEIVSFLIEVQYPDFVRLSEDQGGVSQGELYSCTAVIRMKGFPKSRWSRNGSGWASGRWGVVTLGNQWGVIWGWERFSCHRRLLWQFLIRADRWR
ncbi:MAG: hypothetical protein M2R45_05329 [Verrucomicrobia subdivision 3 bacterium]|nr:hypothetical protein [Limisphaerales bacterium]MCS1414952.1 hypothetical protein [Limisphaerales bacterium]